MPDARLSSGRTVPILALAEGRVALQLELAGIAVERPSSMEDAEERLGAFLTDAAGMAFVQESYLDRFSERFRERLAQHSGLPLIVRYPTVGAGAPKADTFISEVIRPVVGHEIRLD